MKLLIIRERTKRSELSRTNRNEIFLDSIEGKMNRLRENLKKLVTGNLSTDLFKGLIDGANNVVVAIDKISQALGKIGSAGAIAGIASFIKMMANFSKYSGFAGVFGGLLNGIKGITSGFVSGGLMGSLNATKAGFADLAKKMELAKIAKIGFNAAMNAVVWTAIIAGISACVKAWDNYVHATENAIKASKERQDGIRDDLQSLNTQKTGLQEIATEYDKLSKKSSMTAEEMKRLSEIKQQIAQISPELVSG